MIVCIWIPCHARDLQIINAHIIDGNGAVIDNGSIHIRDGHIVSVSEKNIKVTGAKLIDAQGKTMMPGFIDAHRHLIRSDPEQWLQQQAADRMREFLEAGFTTVFSAIDPVDAIVELRRRTKTGEIKGPRIIAAGMVPLPMGMGRNVRPGIDMARQDPARLPGGPAEPPAPIPHEQTRAAVHKVAKAGLDAVKTILVVSQGGTEKESLSVVVAEARRLGLPTVTHATSVRDTMAAVDAGVTRLVHTPHIGQLTKEQAQMIAAAGIPVTSTLGVFVPTYARENTQIRARTGVDNIPRFRDLDPFPMDAISSAGAGPVNARMLWNAGVTYAFGTDTTFLPRDSLAQELKPLRLVFSAEDIIAILTRNAAVFAGLGDETGTIEPGKLADLVLIDGDPLEESQDLLNVMMVIKEGEILVDNR